MLSLQVSKTWWTKCSALSVRRLFFSRSHVAWFIFEGTFNSGSKLQRTPPRRWRSPAQIRASGSTRLSVTITTCCRSHGTTSGSRVQTFSCVCLRSQIWLLRVVHRNTAIAFSDRIKSGVVGEQIFLQITEPTEKDMGEYAIEFYDGKGGVRRTVDLTGQGEDEWIQLSHSPTNLDNYK